MAIKNYKPTTPSRRNMSVTDYSSLSKVAPEKSLLEPLNKKSGRNSYGRITVRHRGGGNRRKYRVIDFKRNKIDMPATVKTIEYDPNRSAHIALIQYEDGVKSYITAPEGLKVGDTVMAGPNADIVAGNALALKDMPVGTIVHNVELYPGNGAQLARSAGNSAQLMASKVHTHFLDFLQASLEMYQEIVWQQLVLLVTLTMQMLRLVKPVVSVTWGGDQQFVVL